MIDLEGKTILITGASLGIGKECAITAAQIGATLILIARNRDRLKAVAESLQGNNHCYFPCDVTDNKALEETVSKAVEKTGQISGFIHSAGIERTIPLRNMNQEKYEELFAVNSIAAFNLARLLSKRKYLAPSGSSYIFVSSVMGIRGEPGRVGYSSSKSALLGGARSMALELAPKNIRVNCVLPGVVETEMTSKFFNSIPQHSKEEIIKKHPLGLGQAPDVANICMFLLSDLAMWMTGAEINIDGGYTIR